MDLTWQMLFTVAVTLGIATYAIKKATYATKEGELRFGAFMKVLGLICVAFSVIPFYVLLTGKYDVEKPGETPALIGLIIGFGFAAVFILAEALLVKGSYNHHSITFSTPWSGTKTERWEDLESIKFSGTFSWYLLKFKSGKVMRLSSFLNGHGHLLDFLRSRGHEI